MITKRQGSRVNFNNPIQLTLIVCPHCKGKLISKTSNSIQCQQCMVEFHLINGMPDLRTHSDRYLSLNQERRKAQRLAEKEQNCNLEELARAYYSMTADVDATRREQFVRHILDANHRGYALLERLPKNGAILEVGCGTGGFLAAAFESGRNAIGIDIASRWLVVARKRVSRDKFDENHDRIFPACVEKMPFSDESFDLIVADSLLEHLNEPIQAIREMLRVLKPGGTIWIWSPNGRWPGPDPHVGLWVIKWLPEGMAKWYLKKRRGQIYQPLCRSPRQWYDLIRNNSSNILITFQAADMSGWPKTDRSLRGRIARLLGIVSRIPILNFILTEFGPVGEIQITSESQKMKAS